MHLPRPPAADAVALPRSVHRAAEASGRRFGGARRPVGQAAKRGKPVGTAGRPGSALLGIAPGETGRLALNGGQHWTRAAGPSFRQATRCGTGIRKPRCAFDRSPGRKAGTAGGTLDIAVIDVPVLRLDHRNDRQRLEETVERIRPHLVVLDPLVRLHGVDENAVADIAPILGFLRDLQRRFEAAILLVHHSRKSGATRPGQALRGSSELHAWGDSNLYLRRRDRQIVMTVEHRAAPGLNDIEIELADDGQGPALRLRRQVPDEAPPEPEAPEQRIVQVLMGAEAPLLQSEIRKRAGARNATVTAALQELVREGRVERGPGGRYRFLGAAATRTAMPTASANA